MLAASARFDVRFEQAVAWFQKRIPTLRDADFVALGQHAHQYAFTVAGITQLSLVSEVWDALDKALMDGTTLEQFKRDVALKLKAAWGSAKPHRVETIYRTNIQSAYNAGRYSTLTSPALLAARPIWIYDSVMDVRTSPICTPLNGITLPAKDPFWATHQPPLHHRCRSSIRTSRPDPDLQITDLSTLQLQPPAKDFGAAPFSPVGHPWEPNLARFPQPLRSRAEDVLRRAPPPPPPVASAANVLHQQTAPQAGSNQGGFYTGLDGIKRYCKFYADPAQAYGEHLANNVYRLLGLDAPETVVFEDNGKYILASTILENTGTLGNLGLTKKLATQALDGYAADVLTGNWDVAGLTLDNMVVLKSGKLARIDQGGTFLMRAKAGRKADILLEQITEWTGFPNPATNPAYAQIWAKAGLSGPGELANKLSKQIKAIEKLESALGGWRGYVENALPDLGAADRDKIIGMLEKRTGLLALERKTLDAIVRQKRAAKKAALVSSSNGRYVLDYTEQTAKAWSNLLKSKKSDYGWLESAFAKLYLPNPIDGNATRGRTTIKDGITAFTSGYSTAAYQRRLYKAWQKINVNQQPADPSDDVEYAVQYALVTRAKRWELLAKQLGLPATPTHIKAYRGVHNRNQSNAEAIVEDVLAAWFSSDPTFQFRQYALASWGMTQKAALDFANPQARTLAALFRHEFALEETWVDQLTDDSSFVTTFHNEAEVIAGVGKSGTVVLNKLEQSIYINHVEYTYNTRAQALAAYRQAFQPAFDPSKPRPKVDNEP